MSDNRDEITKDPDGGGRRQEGRRKKQIPLDGPDRRVSDRRTGTDRRKGERRSGVDRRGDS